MITGEIKSRIDSIWDTFWTGGITNSITILEQMTYLFFMKMLDDAQKTKEANASIMGVTVKDPTFKEGLWHNPDTDQDVPYDLLRWSVFRNKDAEEMYRIISRDAFAFIKNLSDGKDSSYSRFMANASFLIQNPRTLTKIVDGIDGLDMNNRDAMGDVYEYVLGKMAASGNNGQFRTPRHIIKMMVDLMQPSLQDTICDPAMGSAGFIVESAKYVQEHYKRELLKTDGMKHYKSGLLHGFDTDSTMLRIGAMNLMLHGVDNPDVEYKDSLSTDNTDENKYTLCLANPPFAGSLDYDAVSKSLLAITKTKKTELLFMALFVRMLQPGGRCASIVPDGVLFGTSTGHKSIRKEIVDNHRLQAVISMPSGVFKPYAGVSTAILIFTKTNAGGTDKVWFYDMKADGFSLDDKRSQIADNDIPDIIARFHNLEAEESRTRKEQSFLVPVEEIREKGYDLSINKYKEIEREVVVYEAPEVIMERIAALETEISEALNEFRNNFM
ncbi:MAG: class I SAM-dependent DNA methyltransferase, partial [Muribaculaceae bacterium]|nr:class I SAM-dependent DNA methyltransferase [Muribaculaceae bacterium]